MTREEMPDILVLIPGISGSQLKKDGRIVWGLSASTVMRNLVSRGNAIVQDLMLIDGSTDVADLGDGVVADQVIPDLHLIPGLWKIDGYSKVFDFLRATFDVTEGENLFPFPYDWRRDNRVAARQLAKSCHSWLKAWRSMSGNDEAKLILVAHSMGGLVARYYLECLEGWKSTKALITFGTPYRGSLNAIETLSSGLREGPFGILDFTTAARSFTAIYQLLPIYPCYDGGEGILQRVGEATGIPNIDPDRAAAALAFHREIEAANAENARLPSYGYKIHSFVGIAQSTRQSARLSASGIIFATNYNGKDAGGDGTVPRVSAQPIEQQANAGAAFFATRHGSLQNSAAVLVNLRGVINSLYLDLGAFRKPNPAAVPARIDLFSPDIIASNQPLRIEAHPDAEGIGLEASIADRNGHAVHVAKMVQTPDGTHVFEFPPLAEGNYTIHVYSSTHGVEPVQDAFAVIDATTY